MKKFLPLFLLLTSLLIVSGCSVINKAKDDAENFKGSLIDAKNDIQDISNKVTETVDDVKYAAEKIDEATKAVNEIKK